MIRGDAPVARPATAMAGRRHAAPGQRHAKRRGGWLAIEHPWPGSLEQLREAAALSADARVFLAPAVVMTKHLTFEYPRTARELVDALARDQSRHACCSV